MLGPWQGHLSGPGTPGQHSSQTMHDAVDFYYDNGFLINFYSHSLSATTGQDDGQATPLTADYVEYCTNTLLHPKAWSANAKDIYAWWLQRSNAQITVTYITNGSHSVANATIIGAQNTNIAIEVLAPGSGLVVVSQLLTHGVAATTDSYRVRGELIKVRVGTSTTNI